MFNVQVMEKSQRKITSRSETIAEPQPIDLALCHIDQSEGRITQGQFNNVSIAGKIEESQG